MGGFHLVEPVEGNSTPNVGVGNKPEGRVTILTLEMLRELVDSPDFEIRMTETEVTDKSKGDALSKLIFTLQSSWFICQCVARRVQGLPLTQLELTTLALASLNGITLILWLDKPLGVEAPVRVYLKHKLTDAERGAGEVSDLFQICSQVAILTRLQRYQSARSLLISSWNPGFVAWVLGKGAEISREMDARVILFRWIPLFLMLGPALFFTVGILFLVTVHDLMGRATSFPVEHTHVPTFYVPIQRYSNRWQVFLLPALGTLFGGIHCAGWNFPFPTSAEQKIWRFTSVALTIIPATVFLNPVFY